MANTFMQVEISDLDIAFTDPSSSVKGFRGGPKTWPLGSLPILNSVFATRDHVRRSSKAKATPGLLAKLSSWPDLDSIRRRNVENQGAPLHFVTAGKSLLAHEGKPLTVGSARLTPHKSGAGTPKGGQY